VSDLVVAFWADHANAALSHGLAGGGVGVGLVQDHHFGAAAWPAGPVAADTDSVKQWQELGVVAGLAGREQDPHWSAAAVDSEVDLGAQSASGSAKVLFRDGERFDGFAGAVPFFRAPAAC
jgi:hypothetical protein